VTRPGPEPSLLAWVERSAAEPRLVRGLREGGAPWLLRAADGTELVLRAGGPDQRASLATEVAALELAGPAGLPVPRLVAADLSGELPGERLAVLTTALPGTSRITSAPSPARLRALGALAAAIHAVPAPAPSAALPRRERSISSVDFAALRRAAPPRELLVRADELLASRPRPPAPDVLVHGDLWQGNTLWDGDALTGVVDWDCAGVGPAGVDVGSLRCDAALTGAEGAPDEVLVGYTSAGGAVDDVAYWDVVAALTTPPTIDWFTGAIRDQGRTDLDQPTLLARRDAFLAAALDRL
jgi:aminoglycoside phosphotransferase (APT) family kinase protein